MITLRFVVDGAKVAHCNLLFSLLITKKWGGDDGFGFEIALYVVLFRSVLLLPP